jgi:hypothetical protein
MSLNCTICEIRSASRDIALDLNDLKYNNVMLCYDKRTVHLQVKTCSLSFDCRYVGASDVSLKFILFTLCRHGQRPFAQFQN